MMASGCGHHAIFGANNAAPSTCTAPENGRTSMFADPTQATTLAQTRADSFRLVIIIALVAPTASSNPATPTSVAHDSCNWTLPPVWATSSGGIGLGMITDSAIAPHNPRLMIYGLSGLVVSVIVSTRNREPGWSGGEHR